MADRADDEILERIKAIEDQDWLGTQRGDLIDVLPFNLAKPFLKDGVKPKQWAPKARDAESIKARIQDYMPFAWDKANNCRGISAARSLDHMKAWLWLLGMNEAVDFLSDYDRYGKPELRAICEAFDWDWREWDDGDWRNDECGKNLGVPEKVEPLPINQAAA